MFTPQMSPAILPTTPSSKATMVTLSGGNLGVSAGMTGGKRPENHGVVVGNFPFVPSTSSSDTGAWGFWGKPARHHILNDLALPSAIHNPHALLTLLPNISLSIYKGLP